MNSPFAEYLQSIGFTSLDVIALVVFLTLWCTQHWVVNHSPWRHLTISARMSGFRQLWMYNMVFRDPKMPDTLIQNTLQYGVLFFASTSILLIGALIAGMGASDHAIELLGDLPFAVGTTRAVWELKILLITFIFTFAFFKFAWTYRLFNYVLILIGAAPDASIPIEHRKDLYDPENYAARVGGLHTLGARHFTTGLNSYFFALAACAWFIGPELFICATIWVSIVLYRRAFWSHFAKTLESIESVDARSEN